MDNPDLQLGVEFFARAVENQAKSREAGRPIFEDKEFVRIVIPGDRLREIVAPAQDMHFVSHERRQMTYAERFAPAYAAFRDGREVSAVGTPLEEAPFLTPARVAELKAQKITTVEQLAGIADANVSRALGMGGRDLVEKAKTFIANANGMSEVEALKRQIDDLKAQMIKPSQGDISDQFSDLDRDDLFNMASDAGLAPRANASKASLLELLREAYAKKVAA